VVVTPTQRIAVTPEPHPIPPGSARNSVRAYLLILVLAAALRAAWAALVPIAPVSDPNAYDVCARNLAVHNTFGYQPGQPWAFWPVGASFAYSLVYRVFAPATFGYTPIAAFNVALGVLMVGLSMACARRWFGHAAALAAGLILACWPTHIEFTTIIASETLFTDLCLAGILAWPDRVSVPRCVLAGLLFAAATYVRPTGVLIPIVLTGARWLRAPRLQDIPMAGATIAVVFAVMAVCIAPWVMRNHRLFGQTVLISTNSGSNLWMGNNPDSTGAYQEPPELPGKNEAERDALRGKLAREYIIAHPVSFVTRTLLKAAKLHATETIGVGWNLDGLKRAAPSALGDERGIGVRGLKAVSTAYWLAVLFLSIPGLFLLAARSGLWHALMHPAVVIWAYFTAVHAVIVIQDRYHLPATPMIASLAALPLVQLWQRYRPRGTP
jgi:hypothetical protein